MNRAVSTHQVKGKYWGKDSNLLIINEPSAVQWRGALMGHNMFEFSGASITIDYDCWVKDPLIE